MQNSNASFLREPRKESKTRLEGTVGDQRPVPRAHGAGRILDLHSRTPAGHSQEELLGHSSEVPHPLLGCVGHDGSGRGAGGPGGVF